MATYLEDAYSLRSVALVMSYSSFVRFLLFMANSAKD